MIKIDSKEIINAVAELFIEVNCHVREEIFKAWMNALEEEDTGSQGREIIQVMIKNAWIAWKEALPICQDTGQPIVFIEQGADIEITGKQIFEAINEGIEKGGREGYLRKSVTLDPLKRDNEGGYGPAIIHHRIVPGETLKITLYPAGCGCEQMNRVVMFPPCDEEKTIREFVLNRVREAGSKPCPPTIIGLGIGGDLEQSGYLARKALLRPINERNKKYEILERRLLKELNSLNIGPHGLGGRTTVLAVNIEAASCHRGNLPIAIAFNCHIGRKKEALLGANDKFTKAGEKEDSLQKQLEEVAQGIRLFENWPRAQLPLTSDLILNLKTGDKILINGPVYTARDAAHRRLVHLIKEGKTLPFNLEGQIIYYTGPTPPRPCQIIGSAGPTTSARMDYYTPILLSHGLKGMIGKGYRNKEVLESIKKNKALYFITFAGSGALLSKRIIKSEMIAFEELGTEAIRKLELKDFPVIVACDSSGNNIYK